MCVYNLFSMEINLIVSQNKVNVLRNLPQCHCNMLILLILLLLKHPYKIFHCKTLGTQLGLVILTV